MMSEYGTWRALTSIHAVGYDGKWLCGRSSNTSSECSESIEYVTCKRCLKKLNEYLVKHAITSDEAKQLSEATGYLQELVNLLEGKPSKCYSENDKGKALYIRSWILPAMKRILKRLDKENKND